MAPPDLIIFDCDGVLVDTETIANTKMAEMISAAGYPISMEECRQRFVGLSMTSMREQLLEEESVDLGVDFVERWNRQLPMLFRQGVDPTPHVDDAIARIRAAGVAYCVASSGRVEKMHITLGSAGLLPILKDVLFSATMVERGKPHPDLFLHAAEKMQVHPSDCAVVEDSVPGVIAAKAAGMRVFGYHNDPLTDRAGLAEAGAVLFGDMRQLPGLLQLE